jgi:16S rRNA (adenine1518-N6/adenine1519-N6)-dimethyltransferase
MPTKLGQNFLVNKDIVNKIIASADLTPEDLVLEIGPGKGILTEELAKHAGKVVAVEIDESLVNLLRNKLRNKEKVEIVEGDILKIFNFQFSIFNQFPISKFSNDKEVIPKVANTKSYKIIANLPYYITSPIIRKFLEAEAPPSEMILMVQKEVAQRITAGPGKMSILSISVQYYAKAEILFYVEKGNFEPVPEVDSAVIRITRDKRQETRLPEPRSGGQARDKNFDKKFFRVVRAGFCAKRKTIVNNLANSFHLEKKTVEEKIKKVGLAPNIRAQELGVDDWKKLAEIFTPTPKCSARKLDVNI